MTSEDPLVLRRVEKLEAFMRGNSILTAECAPFIDAGEWTNDGDGVLICRVAINGVPRIMELHQNMVAIGRADFPERKRIPLS